MGLDIVICVDDMGNENLTQQVSSVEVYEKMDQNTTYKLHFMVDICKEDIATSLEAATSPGNTLSILARVNDEMICLVKGPVTQQETSIEHGGAGSWIRVEGEDTSYTMDRETNFHISNEVKDSDIVSGIISGNPYGMMPDVQDTVAIHHEEDHSQVQRETDLSLIRKLAGQNGFHFWITYDSDGNATGHFKPRTLDMTPQVTFTVNLENNNIDSLAINSDSRRPSRTIGKQISLRTKEEIDGNHVLSDTILALTGMPDAAGTNAQATHLAPVIDDLPGMEARSQALLKETQWFITANCKTSIRRLCNVVRVHTVIVIQGAGTRHSGKYYVTGVKHTIDAASYIMDVELARNGWGA